MTVTPTHRHTRAAHYLRAGGPWHQPTLDDLLARIEPRKVALVDGDRRISTVELNHLVASVAGGLRAAGVRRRQVVSWKLPNRWEAVVLYRACWRIGAVAAPVHHLAGPADTATMRAQAPPDLVVDDERLTVLLAADPVPSSLRIARPADPAVVLFTSGSSGLPKAVVHTHRGLAHKATLMVGVHALRRRDSVLMPAPLAHVSGLLNGILLPGAAGARTVLQAKWDPEAALGLIEAEHVGLMIGPPTFFHGLQGAAGFSRKRVRSLRLISCGGAGVSPEFVAEAAEAFDAVVKRTYGSTEAPTVTTAHAGDPTKKARRTDGRPTGEVEIRIDPATQEIQVRGPELFAGYTDRAWTAEAFARGGWFRTGDRGLIDADGWLTVTGRLKELIIRGGENIAMSEVEGHALANPAVSQAVAVAVPERRLGEQVGLAVVLAPGARFDLDDCRDWFATLGVAKFKTPEHLLVLDELPTLPAGKPDRQRLSAMVASGHS